MYGELSSSSIESATIDALHAEVADVYAQLDALEGAGGSEEALLKMHLHAHRIGRKSLRLASEEGRRIWTTFNLPLMIMGLLVCGTGAVIRVAFLTQAYEVSLRSFGTPAVGLFTVELCGLFSNSFIEAEHQVTMFITVTLATGLFVRSYSQTQSYEVLLGKNLTFFPRAHMDRSMCRNSLHSSALRSVRPGAMVSRARAHSGGLLSALDVGTWIQLVCSSCSSEKIVIQVHTFLPSLALGALVWKTLKSGINAKMFIVQITLVRHGTFEALYTKNTCRCWDTG